MEDDRENGQEDDFQDVFRNDLEDDLAAVPSRH